MKNMHILQTKKEPKQKDEKGNPLTFWGGLAEPKQETLEESFSRYENEKYHSPTQGSIPDLESAKFGAKWKQERSYSEEDMKDYANYCLLIKKALNPKEWFEQFKKKKNHETNL